VDDPGEHGIACMRVVLTVCILHAVCRFRDLTFVTLFVRAAAGSLARVKRTCCDVVVLFYLRWYSLSVKLRSWLRLVEGTEHV
jgi:hypothetical protein